jgi:hypothetical protein
MTPKKNPLLSAALGIISAAALALACGANTPTASASGHGPSASVAECASPQAGWIFCDDFESDRSAKYFEIDYAQGALARSAGVGVGKSYGVLGRYSPGKPNAGSLKVAFGKTPSAYFRAVDAGTASYREIYWRMYVRNDSAWTGGGADKLSRATSLVSSGWAQAMIAHVWSGSGANNAYLYVDPASGTDVAGAVQTTSYNDLSHFRWLGAAKGTTALFTAPAIGAWHCVEAHVVLNAAGASDGVAEMWVDGNLDARKTGINWVGSFSDYGINAVFFENYWNSGAPVVQQRYFDDLVVSTQRIGCHA